MFKLVVLSVVFAAALAAPGYLGGYGHHGYALPAATSYSSRIDVHSKPAIVAYAAPVVTKTLIAAPVIAAPVIGHHHHGYDLHEPVGISSYGYGVGHVGLGHGYGLGHGLESYGSYDESYGHGHGHGW